MRKAIPFLCLAVAVFCGCDTVNRSQFLIAGNLATVEADNASVRSIVSDTATAYSLADGTEGARLPSKICYYFEANIHFPITLGARTAEELFVVDLYQFHPGVGKTIKYAKIERSLTSRLRAAFGSRLSIPKDSRDFVPFTKEESDGPSP